jgi:hypothetical protein
MPANAGIQQSSEQVLDSRLRGNDDRPRSRLKARRAAPHSRAGLAHRGAARLTIAFASTPLSAPY